MTPEHDAYLRLAFYRVCEDIEGWKKNPAKAFAQLYEYVINTEGGLYVLKEMECLKLEVEKLQKEVDRLNGLLSAYKKPLPVKE